VGRLAAYGQAAKIVQSLNLMTRPEAVKVPCPVRIIDEKIGTESKDGLVVFNLRGESVVATLK